MLPRFLCIVLVLSLPNLALGERPEAWAVVGLSDPSTPGDSDMLELVRGALSLELAVSGGGRVLPEEETRLRLGVPRSTLRHVRERIDAAELYYFQLELDAARTNLERALDDLGHAAGVPEAWDASRMARMLLAMVHLADEREGSSQRAQDQLERIARLEPALPAGRAYYPADLVALYEEAKKRVATLPRGSIRARCATACPDGHVWVDGQPRGIPGEPIDLPVGTYSVVVTDRFDQPTIRSLPREIEVRDGIRATVEVELGWEGQVVADGPWLGSNVGSRLPEVAARLLARRVIVVKPGEGKVQGWLLDGSDGRMLAEEQVTLDEIDPAPAISAMVKGLLRPRIGVPMAAVASAGDEFDLRKEAATRPRSAEWLPWARWSSTAIAVLAAGTGVALHAGASSDEAELSSRLDAWGGAFPSAEAARAGRATLDDVDTRRAWGTGLLVGAGVTGAAALTLFLLEADADGGGLSFRF